MMGRMITVPTSANNWLERLDDASQIVNEGGTMLGQMLITRPLYPRKHNASVSRNGIASCCNRTERKIPHTHATTGIGTGRNHPRLPLPNHRCSTAGRPITVQRLTIAI